MNCECGCGEKVTKGKRFVSGHNGRGRRKTPAEITCQHCGDTFCVRPHLSNRVYCSRYCRDAFRRSRTGENHPFYNRETVPCEICNAPVSVTPSRLKRREQRAFCSSECGKESHRRALAGVPKSCNRSGKNAARVRDGGKCVLCGFEHATAVHHINRVKDGGTNKLTNLVTLCPNHHYMLHAGLLTTAELLPFAKPFSFFNGVPVLTSAVRSRGPSFRTPN